MDDHPFDDVVASAEEVIASGARVYQKFTCEECGQRLTMGEPDRFYTTGSCDRCGHVTDIQANGCNYLVVAGIPLPPQEERSAP